MGESGFALVDALTGLTLLSTTIVFALGAANVARRASVSAVEVRKGAQALDYLVGVPFTDVGEQFGATPNGRWRIVLAPESVRIGTTTVALCRRTAEIKGRRLITAATLEACPKVQGA